jgi:GNAT superfamily N-acetyltransferase
VRIVSFPEAEVPRDLRLQVVALQDQAWPSEEQAGPGPRHDPLLRPLSMLLVDRGHVLAALDILSKDLMHGGQTYLASGLSTVVTDPVHRGKGYGRRLVAAAHHVIEDTGADLGIFTCDRYLLPFYERAGWEWLPGAALIGGTPASPFPSDRFDKVTMVAFFSPKAQAAAGSFVGARIELYPGEIDRLW